MIGTVELIPIMINGDKDNRINIVVVNRWVKNEGNPYNKPELREEFMQHVRDVIEPAFNPDSDEAVQPFASQRGFFNAYALWWPSIPPWNPRAFDKGEKAMHWTIYNEIRARLFLPWNIEGKGWVTHMAKGKWNGEASGGKLTVTGEGPDGGRFDMLYTARHENMSHPVYVGNEFHPPKAGNYFVAAQREDTGAISYNRVGVAVSMSPTPRVQGDLVKPDQVASSKLLLWLDAADLDGDGVEDSGQWDRGSLLGWRGKPGGWNATSFFIYEPDTLNDRPVASWQYIWLQTLEESVKNYQTIIMVYRDHELSQKGTGPWAGVPAYIWDLQDEEVPERLRKAKVWMNGEIVNPCATPPPMEFCAATFEYESRGGNINRTETKWEGAVAEFLVYDGKLTEEERLGVEEYLRQKWTSEVHLEGPGTTIGTEK